jgi:hypothetical protein
VPAGDPFRTEAGEIKIPRLLGWDILLDEIGEDEFERLAQIAVSKNGLAPGALIDKRFDFPDSLVSVAAWTLHFGASFTGSAGI